MYFTSEFHGYQMDPLLLSQAESTAPALNRGLALLAVLAEEGPMTLEAAAARLRLPKASVFRLLGTLQSIGLIRKTADKRYEALWALQPLHDPRELFRERVAKRMPALCERTGCTVEWYEAVADGMKLVAQVNPESELRVQAKPGFLRAWSLEFEAVARLGHAFAETAPAVENTRMYVENGVLKSISRKEARQMLETARRDQSAVDLAYNTNGVRRLAVAAFEDGQFRGVLALAEAFHFSRKSRAPTQLKVLAQALELV